MRSLSIVVRADWDPEARVFVATSEDVPGLITEAKTSEELVEKLQTLVPELLELNRDHGPANDDDVYEVPLFIMHQHMSKIRIHA